MLVEKIVKLLSQVAQLATIAVLDAGGADYSFEELSLQDNFDALMDIVRFDTETLVELLSVFIFFFIVRTAGVVVLFGCSDFALVSLASVDEVKFVHLSRSKKSEMILAALIVNAIKLGQTAVSSDDMSVSQKAPDLS